MILTDLKRKINHRNFQGAVLVWRHWVCFCRSLRMAEGESMRQMVGLVALVFLALGCGSGSNKAPDTGTQDTVVPDGASGWNPGFAGRPGR